ncbi:MAG TPA: AarF/UbiB family protein [Thermoanaerobaculia bacterium]|nr:AarF/UbiB family protein [Thermoanaerobaculia bacterium]
MTPFANARRLLHILRLLSGYLIASLLASRLGAARLARLRLIGRLAPGALLAGPERLRRLFEDLGGTFVKFGQMLALQPDILSPEYCNALFDLLDRVEPFPYADVRRVVTEELGRPPEEIFVAFDPVPLATASVGQVHVAYLAAGAGGGAGTVGPAGNPGDACKVAVKVQRPRVEVEFSSDLRLMAAFMTAIRWLRLRPLYWMLEPGREFIGWTWEEIDYRHEARYSERLRALARGNPIQRVPRVFTEYTTPRTLVVEFLEGVTLLAYLRARERGDQVLPRRLKAMGFDGHRFAANVIDNLIGDAFRNGLYHADLHPANLMILPDNVVGYIDFGITGVLSPYSRQHLMLMTLALAQGDMDRLAGEFLMLSVYGPASDPAAFRTGLHELARGWYEQEAGQRRLQVNFTRVMTDMLQLSRATNVMPERDIVKYIRSAIAIDGLNLRFEPGFHVGRHLERECGRFLELQAMRNAFSEDTVLSWSALGPKLMAEGPARASGFLERLARGDLMVGAQVVETERRDPATAGARGDRPAPASRGESWARTRAVNLAGMVLGLAALMSVTGDRVALGWNLFTVEAALIVAGLAMLVPAVRRLV